MILVTGGSGFIGSHTVRALSDHGEGSVLLQRRSNQVPPHLADLPVVAEQGDIGDLASLLDIGARHDITGVVHLAGYEAWLHTSRPPVEATRAAIDGLLNVVEAARQWNVARVGVASTIGVYGGAPGDGPLTEDMPVLLSAPHPIPRSKKITELLTEQLSEALDVELVNYRISATWGPLGHDDPFVPAPELIHAAARGTTPDLSRLIGPTLAGDALDLCYVKDTAEGIARLQLADQLNHRTYNVASGRATTNADVVAAIQTVVPDFAVDLPTGEAGPRRPMDTSRLHQDTGYTPQYDTRHAAADYIAWLRAGNER